MCLASILPISGTVFPFCLFLCQVGEGGRGRQASLGSQAYATMTFYFLLPWQYNLLKHQFYLKIYFYLYVMGAGYICVLVHDGPKEGVRSSELELQVFLSHPTWVLGMELMASRRTENALSHHLSSPSTEVFNLDKVQIVNRFSCYLALGPKELLATFSHNNDAPHTSMTRKYFLLLLCT